MLPFYLFDFNQESCVLIDPHVLIFATRRYLYKQASSNESLFEKIRMTTSLFTNTTNTELNFSEISKNPNTARLEGTCGLTFRGKFYIFGGKDFTSPFSVTFNHSKQIGRLDGCIIQLVCLKKFVILVLTLLPVRVLLHAMISIWLLVLNWKTQARLQNFPIERPNLLMYSIK